jgi:hypothetical protein
MSAARRADVEKVEEEARQARSSQGRRRLHPVKRVLLGVAGVSLLLVGLALLVLPGPGLLLVLAGLIVLGRAVPAVSRFEEPVRIRSMQAVDASVASPWRIAGSVLTGLALIAAGIVWGARLVPRLPFGGWSTGSSLILSGLVVLGLLGWSLRRVRRTSDRGR